MFEPVALKRPTRADRTVLNFRIPFMGLLRWASYTDHDLGVVCVQLSPGEVFIRDTDPNLNFEEAFYP